MARIRTEFDLWLIELLHTLDVDGEVYGGYISGTLGAMDDVPQGEIEEVLVDILMGCVVSVQMTST